MADNNNNLQQNATEVATSLIEKLGQEPCILGMLTAFAFAILIIWQNNRSHERLELARIEQDERLRSPK